MAQKSRFEEDSEAISVVESDSEVDDVCLAINSLQEESQQVSELLILEGYYCREVVQELKQIMTPKKSSLHLNPLAISNPAFSSAVLTSDAIVCLSDERGKVMVRKSLAEFQGETLLKIIDEILPEVKNLAMAQQSEGLSTIKRISRELKKIVYGEDTVKEKEQTTIQN